MLRRPQVRQQRRHLVEGSPPHRLVIATARQVVADLFLVDPEEPVKGEHVGVTDEGQAVVARVEGLAV